MHYLSIAWDILNLLGSIAMAVVALGLLTGRLELRRPSRSETPRTIVVHEALDTSATAREIVRLQKMQGGA